MLFNRAAVYENQTVLISSCKQINSSAVLCYTFLEMRIMQVSSGAGQHSKQASKITSRPSCWLDGFTYNQLLCLPFTECLI